MYHFVLYNEELFVYAWPSMDYGYGKSALAQNPNGFYRPILNDKTKAIDLEQVEDSLAEELNKERKLHK